MSTPVSPSTEAIAALHTTPLFASLDPHELAAVHEAVEWLTLDPGEALFRFGEPGDSLYVVVQGRLEAELPDADGGSRVVAIAPGDSVGELALLTGAPRSADVRAVRHSLLVRLGRDRFFELTRKLPDVMLGIARVISERLATSGHVRARIGPRVLSVIGGPGPWFDAFVERLAAALPGRAPVLDFDAAQAGTLSDEAGLADLQRVGTWLADLEREHEWLILRADPRSPNWTRACLALTDTVLVVAHATSGPRLPDASLARGDGSRLRRVELVLLHPPSTSVPRGTRRWLDTIAVDAHHHLRHGHARDLARLCRRLSGDSIAVAFGGGAARGLAHLGALRAFTELEVPIDLTCGTSFGSVIGAVIALDHDLARITGEFARYFSDYMLLRPTALPVLSMLSNSPLESMCRELFGDAEVEDTWLPYFAVASNLGDACPELMTSGSLAFAVQASGSVPGLWPPVFRGSQVLVDGVITNNLPGDEIAKLHQGRTIAINLVPRHDPLFSAETVPRSRAKALLGRLSPFAQSRQPLLPDLALRSLFMSTVRHAEAVRKQVDLFIEPDVGGFGFLFEAARREQIVDAGYRATTAALRGWTR